MVCGTANIKKPDRLVLCRTFSRRVRGNQYAIFELLCRKNSVERTNFSPTRNESTTCLRSVLVDCTSAIRVQLSAVEFPMAVLSAAAFKFLFTGAKRNPRRRTAVEEINVALDFFGIGVVPIGQRRIEVSAAKAGIGTDGAKNHLRAFLAKNDELAHAIPDPARQLKSDRHYSTTTPALLRSTSSRRWLCLANPPLPGIRVATCSLRVSAVKSRAQERSL